MASGMSLDSPGKSNKGEFDHAPTTARPPKIRALFWEPIGQYQIDKSVWLGVHLNKKRLKIKFEDIYKIFEDIKEISDMGKRKDTVCHFIEDAKRINAMDMALNRYLVVNK